MQQKENEQQGIIKKGGNSLKARTRTIMFILLIGAAAFAGYKVYDYYRDDSLLHRIVTQDGYQLTQANTADSTRLEFKPEWLKTEYQESRTLNVPVGYDHQTLFVLEKIRSEADAVIFSMKAIPELKKEEGEFLYTAEIHGNGAFSPAAPNVPWAFLDQSGNKIDINGVKYKIEPEAGPSARFSLEISKTGLDKLAAGFTAEYTGFNLYTYSRK
ncbi:hypothetical protein ACFOLF_06865 [Paenibacillus sepulcri]|uniref:Uncharacterized protein n=1 Tax=Paenibacillus sepulcri TaxID=359917 RepID=A0ABS7C2T2_9BACL|nr:hypothetical protein [Paenibacillus sepulcri]